MNEPKNQKRLPPVETRFKPGQSGNPAGRPKGTSRLGKRLKRQAREEALVELSGGARKVLQAKSLEITSEIIALALRKEVKPSMVKVKCLLACFERIVPSLKSVETNTGLEGRRAGDLSDEEIVQLMERMVQMASFQGGPPSGETIN